MGDPLTMESPGNGKALEILSAFAHDELAEKPKQVRKNKLCWVNF